MSAADRERWDAKYAARPAAPPEPEAWFVETVEGWNPGTALDVACGLGQHALWLARRGWRVQGVDVSPVGLGHARRLAEAVGACVDWVAADLDEFAPPPAAFDLIIVFRYLDRQRLPAQLVRALKPGGRLIYETFVAGGASAGGHCRNPAYLLQPGELPRLFADLEILATSEVDLPGRRVARLVGQKRLSAAD